MSEFVIARTEYGKIRGQQKVSALGTEYVNFLGVPYAKPPVNELRFKDPVPPSKWTEVLDTLEEKSCCYGVNELTQNAVGSEDSLYLNIFTKNVKPEKPYPVMVYIHGGAFNSGSSSTERYAPDYLLMADVVIVTLNYRLGPMGFMSFKDKELNVPGNAGMKDQVMALKFVKNNINQFGGDSDNITFFGHSAGGYSVSWHCVSKLSRGLFNKAIIMSGCILSLGGLTLQLGWPLRMAKALGYEGDEENKDVLEFLQKADPSEMVKIQKFLITKEIAGKVQLPFAPHVEPYETDGTFNTEHPINLLDSAWSNDIDILIGGTSDEGIMFLEKLRSNPAALAGFKLEHMVPSELELSFSDPKRVEFAEKLRELYYPSSEPNKDTAGYCKLMTDKVFWHGQQRLVQARQKHNAAGKTFLYRFAVDSPTQNHHRITRLGPDERGVSHADELSYLFKNIYGGVPEKSSIEFKTIERFVSVFTSFAATGDPNDNICNADMQGVRWEPVTGSDVPFKCFNIDNDLSFIDLPEAKRLAVWDQMFNELNVRLY